MTRFLFERRSKRRGDCSARDGGRAGWHVGGLRQVWNFGQILNEKILAAAAAL
jgi:hypothetical protein